MKPIYGVTPSGHPRVKLPPELDLDKKTVAFRMPTPEEATMIATGVGQFDVVELPEGFHRLDIVVDQQNPYGGVVTRFHIPQEGVNVIRKLRESGRCSFQLICT